MTIERMEELVALLNEYAHQYYDLDNPTVSDAEFDALYDELVALESSLGIVLPDSPTKRVGGKVNRGFETVRHRERLFSLDKSKTKEGLAKFIERVGEENGEWVDLTLEYKYDGLTLNLTYTGGRLVRAVTRGDGEEGEDVTLQALTIGDIPKQIPFLGSVDVQGECIMRLSALAAYNASAKVPLKNARNAAAGGIRNINVEEAASRKLSFMAYNVGYHEGIRFATQEEVHEFLVEMGFCCREYFRLIRQGDDWAAWLDEVEAARPTLDYLIDGMVLKVNDLALREELGFTAKFPKWAIAYKFHAEEVVSKVLRVVWQVSRTGKLNPLAELEPVDIGGATVSRATLSNISEIRRKDIRIGSNVFVRRSGDVIPEILGIARHNEDSVEPEAPKFCPACGAPVEEKGIFLYCSDKEHCAPRVVAELEHFASKDAMDIEGLSEKTIEQLYNDLGVRSTVDLYRLRVEELLTLEGFKEKKAANLVGAIERSKKTTLARFITALGIPNIGKRTAEMLAETFGSLEALACADTMTLLALDDFGQVMTDSVLDYFADREKQENIRALLEVGIEFRVDEAVDGPFSGETVVLTGSLEKYKRSKAAELIKAKGGKVADGISARVTLVVAGADAGSKLAKAQKLGIPVIDEAAFLERLGE